MSLIIDSFYSPTEKLTGLEYPKLIPHYKTWESVFKVDCIREELKVLRGIIYKITSLVNGKSYIGQTTDSFYERYGNTFTWWNNVDNILLDRSIKKYGKDKFTITILEYNQQPEFLNELEDLYIDQFNAMKPNGFNIRRAGSKGKFSNEDRDARCSETIHTVKSPKGEIFSFRNIGRFCEENGLNKGNLTNVIKGKYKQYKLWTLPETILEDKFNNFRSPTGEIISVKRGTLTHFCKNHGLHAPTMNNMLAKRRVISHKGWTLPETVLKTKKIIKLKSPENKIYEIIEGQFASFFRTHNLVPSSISDVLNRKINNHRGWTLPDTEIFFRKYRSPNGDVFSFKNGEITSFCRKNNLKHSGFYALDTGRCKHYKGWTKL